MLIRSSRPAGNRTARGTALTAVVAGLFAVSAAGAAANTSGAPGAWTSAGQNIFDTHSQPFEHTISPANVNTLAPRWTLTTAGAVSATPTVADGVVYVPDFGGKLWAIAARSGTVLWSRDISSYTGVAGDVSRTSPAVYGDELILGDGWLLKSGTDGAREFAVNRHTGDLIWSTQVDTDPDAGITGSPVVYNGVIYQGISSKGEATTTSTFRGAIAAIDAATGRTRWKMYTVPSNNGDSDSNLPGGYTGNAVWDSSPVIDPVRGLLYTGTGNNYNVPAGVCAEPGQTDCTPAAADDYLDAILALHLKDGSVAWADRTLSADLWTIPQPDGPDYDFGAGPNLFTTTNPKTGRPEQLLGIGQKSGIYWAVDPATGKVAWQTPVGPGTGIEWGTATDGKRVYVPFADVAHTAYTLGGSGPYAGQTATAGSWTALDPATGKILWQTPDPTGAVDVSFTSTANGVVYAGSLDATGTDMYALDAATGKILWSFAGGGSVSGGAAISNGSVYWGSGYCGVFCLGSSTPVLNNDKLYAFGPR